MNIFGQHLAAISTLKKSDADPRLHYSPNNLPLHWHYSPITPLTGCGSNFSEFRFRAMFEEYHDADKISGALMDCVRTKFGG